MTPCSFRYWIASSFALVSPSFAFSWLDQIALLDDVSAPPGLHPYDFIAEGQREP